MPNLSAYAQLICTQVFFELTFLLDAGVKLLSKCIAIDRGRLVSYSSTASSRTLLSHNREVLGAGIFGLHYFSSPCIT